MLYNYASVFERCEPFVIAHRGFVGRLPREVAGVAIPAANVIDPQARKNAEFLGLLRLLDTLCFGPNGMPMPSWVFYDCAVMPGGFFGLGIRARQLEPWCLEAMKVPAGYTGLVPISQLIAIPMLAGFLAQSGASSATATASAASALPAPSTPHTWLSYSLESINQVSPGFAPAGVLKLTLALGLQLFPIHTLYATTQWRSHKLATYVELGPVELVTAYTPAHSLPRTCSFRIDVGAMKLETLLAGPAVHPAAEPPNDWVDPDSEAELRALQRDIEGGSVVHLVGKPQVFGAQIRIPIHRCGRSDVAAPRGSEA